MSFSQTGAKIVSKLFLNPYINFDGQCREAMEFYHKVIGGKLELSAFNEHGVPKPAGPNDRIMHSRLESDGFLLMATDGREDHPSKHGENVSLALGGTDRERLHKIFDGLSEGGRVDMPLKGESWGDEFGMFDDKFGISWMVNISKPD
jgi:PhnB protein